MSDQIGIDHDRCTGCGSCVEVCPYRLFFIEGDKAVIQNKDCFLCGHCRAVCLTGAVVIKDLHRLETLEFKPPAGNKAQDLTDANATASSLMKIMELRRSCRNFTPEAVPVQLLSDLVKIGTLAPSGTNCQDWEFTLLPEKKDVIHLGSLVSNYYQKLNRLAEKPLLRNFLKMIGKDSLYNYYKNYYESVEEALKEWEEEQVDRLFHGAAAVIIVSNRTAASCPKEDALLATQNILLAAESIGLGSCLIGFAVEAIQRNPAIQKKLGIPPGEKVYSVICLGYPAIKYYRAAGRKQVTPRIVRFGAPQ